MQSMERSHLERGFAEIAQQFTTFPDGTIGIGRPLNNIPAGIKGANAYGICIEHLGYFDLNGDTMTDEHRNTIIGINAILLKVFSLPVNENTVVYHHWYDLNTAERTNGTGTTKSCPGTNFFGGNTVAAAKANFYPIVEAKLLELNAQVESGAKSLYTSVGIVIPKKLNVRSAPSLNSTIIGSLAMGTPVRLFEQQSDFTKISASSSRWVKSEYIQAEQN